MRLVRYSALAVVLATAGLSSLAGCGEDPKPNDGADAGTGPGVGDLEAYFSLQKGRCFEYTLQDSKQPLADLGVAVEEIDMNQFSQAAPQGTHVIRYRQGFLKMTDYVSFTDEGELKLHKREFSGGKNFIYRPAITLLKAPIKGNDRIDSGELVNIRDSAQGTEIALNEGFKLRVDTLEPTELRLPIGETVQAYKAIFDETYSTQTSLKRPETRSFVPGGENRAAATGFVTLEFNFDADESLPKKVYRLQNVRELSGQVDDVCGSAP